MTRNKIEDVLNSYYLLKPPAKVVILDKPLAAIQDGMLRLAGATPAWRYDVIILGSDADEETVIHETLHTYGLKERVVQPLAKVMVIKYRILKSMPLLKSIRDRILGQKVKYREVRPEEAREILKELYVHIPPRANPKLLVKV